MTATTRAYVALGSNLGDRRGILRSAIRSLAETPGISVVAVSTIRETPPVGPPEQGPFLNGVAGLATSLEPRALLETCLRVERRHGRRRTTDERWGPRTLDLDLLLHGDRVIDEPGLTVPHPRLHERSFVLEPLAEIAGGVVHPVLGLSVESMWARLEAEPDPTELNPTEQNPTELNPTPLNPTHGAPNPTCDGTRPR